VKETGMVFKILLVQTYNMKKGIFHTILIALVIVFSLSGCVEHRYYHENHRHTDRYNHRHHRTNAEIDVHLHN
jgi:hypothetical protein